jgi:hypothetical protein
MTEILFLLAVVFIGYVYLGTGKNQALAASPPDKPVKPEPSPLPVKATIAPVAVKPAKAPAKKPETAASPKPKAAATSSSKPVPVPKTADKRGLKDPKTGEVATRYSNYRFTKHWIKEALVAEGFLDKVYKNDELTTDIETHIKRALTQLEAMKKYQA